MGEIGISRQIMVDIIEIRIVSQLIWAGTVVIF